MIEGAFDFKIEDKPMQKLEAGATFYEPIMVLHEIGRNASEIARARVLAVTVHPRDADRLVIPEKPDNE